MKAVAWKSLIAPATDFFTDTEVENFNSSSPYSAFLWDLRNYCSTFYADPGVVYAGAKLDTRGHRSATDFALGPFFTCKFSSIEKARKLWPFRNILLSKLPWQRHYHGGWNHKTLPTVCLPKCPSWCQFESIPQWWLKHHIKLLPRFPPF